MMGLINLGPALAMEPSYQRAVAQISGVHDRDAVMLAVYMRKLSSLILNFVRLSISIVII